MHQIELTGDAPNAEAAHEDTARSDGAGRVRSDQ